MKRRKRFLLVAIFLALITTGLMAWRYLGYIVAGLLLAFLLYPLQQRFENWLNSTVVAALLVALTMLAAILPFVIILGAVAGDATRLMEGVQQGDLTYIQALESQIEQLTGIQVDLRDRLSPLFSLWPRQ